MTTPGLLSHAAISWSRNDCNSGLSIPRVRTLVCAIGIALTATILQACSIAGSAMFTGSGGAAGCHSDAGSYYLSKSLIRVTVNTAQGAGNYVPRVEVVPTADRSRGYCLDFLASLTAEEALFIQKDRDNLLMKITSDSQDKSVEIIKNIIQTVFVGISGNADFNENLRASRLERPLEFEFDPFNPSEVALVNHALSDPDVGLCIALEGGGIDPRFDGDIRDYCDDPLRFASPGEAIIAASKQQAISGFTPYDRGVLYRPRVPYNIFMFRLEAGQWTLLATDTVLLENRSPMVSVGIERALFTDRKTRVVFNHGALEDIQVEKGSELADASEIPLVIAENIAALPANTLKVQLDITNKRTALIEAQDRLLQAQTRYNADLHALKTERGEVSNEELQRGAEQPGERIEPEDAPQSTPAVQDDLAGLAASLSQCMATECTGASADRCRAYCECTSLCGAEDKDTCRRSCQGNLN